MNDEKSKDMIKNPEIEAAESEPVAEELQTPEREWRPQDADRFEYKETIRKRVRNSQVHPNAIFKPAKPAPAIDDPSQKKVAVYARVSTKSKNQVSSIENQQKYYTKKINDTPNWEMHQIYSDEGISGTSVKKRKAFLQMIDDAVDKDMDLILCASVSRFARNMTECLEYIDLLRTANPSHPVGVYFETEGIYTLDPKSGQQMDIYAMLADWESATKSSRMILSYDQRICTGQYPVSDLLGYRHTEDGGLIIQEEEAKTVRLIFLAYILGYTHSQIAEILTTKARPTLHGRTLWNASMVRNIMQNERRWGDLDVRKTIVINYKKGKTKKNEGERDSVYVPGYHEGIVTPDIARAAKLVGISCTDGACDVGVIRTGALKGFVSIPLGWNAVDNDMLHQICRSAFSPDELAAMEQEARILTGEEHSKILSLGFAGYQIPLGVTYLTKSMPSMTISPRKISFNKACHDRLDCCEYVELLYHPIMQMIVIRPCEADSPCAIRWKNENKTEISAFSSRALISAIYEKRKWKQNLKFRFRCVTKERDGVKIMFVSLDEPQIIPDKRTREVVGSSFPIQYIPHNLIDEEPDGHSVMDPSDDFGVSLAVRKLRDSLPEAITRDDIIQQTHVVDNPLIGTIPTKAEVAQEFEQLLLSM